MLRGLATVNFYADDVAEAARWYAGFLGVEPYYSVPGPDGTPAYIEFRLGDYQHELGFIDRRYAPAGATNRGGGALANWHVAHQFCPRCGAPTEPEQAGWIRRCTRDSSEHYPRTDPAVIMAVVDDDDRLLLGRNAQWPEGRFSVLAGFVEPGESFEAAVVREVDEEVGIAVTDVTYLGNQPWPFPSSDMIGFRARATTTELRPDQVEMAEARWFTRDDYTQALRDKTIRTPSGISIAQRLIEHWLGRRVADVIGADAAPWR
jgi:NAD+ diphosphatase